MPLTAQQFPYTGPYLGPSSSRGPNKGPTAKALKRMLIRLKLFEGDLASLDEHYSRPLEAAMKRWQKTLPDVQPSGQYGRGSWEEARKARVKGGPHDGEYALDSVARQLVRNEWKADQVPTSSDARKAITDFCVRAEAAERVWTYSQRRPFTGIGVPPEESHTNDCSGYAVLTYAWAKKITGLDITDPSGYKFSGSGNTWDNLDGHPKVAGSYLVGDLAHYDGHVTVCRKAGDAWSSMFSSMGSDAGPDARQLFYRSDLLFVVRPPL